MNATESDSFATPRTSFGPDRPICWPRLNDDDAAEMIDELSDCVQWLTHRFTLDHRTVPPCWNQHGPVIEELSALCTAWQTAYTPTAGGDGPLAWMNHFSIARQRLAGPSGLTGS